MKTVPVTAIVPVFNRTPAALEALRSIFAQTMRPEQVILVDDGSTDDVEAIRTFLGQQGGEYLRQENAGVAAARNLGVSHAQREWIAFLDSDDTWLPEKLECQFQLHVNQPELVISQTKERWMRNGTEVRQNARQTPASGECFERSLGICCISASAVMIRKEIFLAEGGFDAEFAICEDFDLWLRLTSKYPVGLVDQALVVKNRGRADHLSESVEAPDRFRMRALIKMLSLPISSVQREQVLRALDFRLSILESGARRRGQESDLISYERIRQQYFGASPAR